MSRVPELLSYPSDWHSLTVDCYSLFIRKPEYIYGAPQVYSRIKQNCGLIHETGKGPDAITYTLYLDGKHHEYVLRTKQKPPRLTRPPKTSPC